MKCPPQRSIECVAPIDIGHEIVFATMFFYPPRGNILGRFGNVQKFATENEKDRMHKLYCVSIRNDNACVHLEKCLKNVAIISMFLFHF